MLCDLRFLREDAGGCPPDWSVCQGGLSLSNPPPIRREAAARWAWWPAGQRLLTGWLGEETQFDRALSVNAFKASTRLAARAFHVAELLAAVAGGARLSCHSAGRVPARRNALPQQAQPKRWATAGRAGSAMTSLHPV